MPPVAKSDVTQHLGEISDHTVVEVLRMKPDIESLEDVAMWLAQEDDVMGDARKPLRGVAARIYDIVTRDPLYAENQGEERRSAP